MSTLVTSRTSQAESPVEQCQTMATNTTTLTLVTSNINLSQLAEQSKPELLVERQTESLIEQCQTVSNN